MNGMAIALLSGMVWLATAASASHPPALVGRVEIQLSIKPISSWMEAADQQIIWPVKHQEASDPYPGAAEVTDALLGSPLSALRYIRGRASGSRERMVFTPNKSSIRFNQFKLIGLRKEVDLLLESLWAADCFAARDLARLKVGGTGPAPVIRDQGNSNTELGLGDRDCAEGISSACGPGTRVQTQEHSPDLSIESCVIRCAPAFLTKQPRS